MTVLIIIFLTAILALFAGVFQQGKYSRYIGLAGLLAALWASYMSEAAFFERYTSMFIFDAPAVLFTRVAVTITLLVFFIAGFAFSNHRSHQSELYSLMLFALCGGIVLFGYQNLVMLFLGIEILSIPLYVMAGSSKTDVRSSEAAMKYFLMGAFATGFLLFGIAMIYGVTGTFDMISIHEYSGMIGNHPMFILGMIMMLSSLAFKVSLAPFHMWSPDVYHGAPTLITTFMASVVKIAAFGALFKLMVMAFTGIIGSWINIIGSFVIISLLLANCMGLVQNNVKRMLAYSSVSHAGYIGLIFFGINDFSLYTLTFYLFVYSLATVGVFMSVIWVEKVKRDLSFDAFRGLAKTEPLLAVTAAVSLLSMAGIPLTAGFVGKFSLFAQAMNGAAFLVIIAVIGSAISIAYYLRLIIMMFFDKESSFRTSEKSTLTYKIIAVLLIVLIFAFGIYPDLFTQQFMR